MLHEPASHDEVPDLAAEYKASLGIWMFLVYAIVYSGFIAIRLFCPDAMKMIVLLSMNLATVYGFGLIVFALIMAVIYNHLCTSREKHLSTAPEQKGA